MDTRKAEDFSKKQIKYFEAVISKQLQKDALTGKEYFDVIIASDNMDSYGDAIRIKNGDYKRFTSNPIVFYNHKQMEYPIGNDLGLNIDGNKLKGKMWLHELTDESKTVKKLILAGVIKCLSIGFFTRAVTFLPLTEEEKSKLPTYYTEKRWIEEWEMCEYSVVNIPANTDSEIKSAVDGLNNKQYTSEQIFEQLSKEIEALDIEEKSGAKHSTKTKEVLTTIKSLVDELGTHVAGLLATDENKSIVLNDTDVNSALASMASEIKSMKQSNDILNLRLQELTAENKSIQERINEKPKVTTIL